MITGFTSVVGDLFHAGHVAMIQECRQHCDRLIVGLMCNTNDRPKKNRPVQSVFERFMQLKFCKGVDMVIPLDTEKDLELALKVLSPIIQIRFVGTEYRDVEFTGRRVCEENGIEIMYTNRNHGLSSTELRQRIKEQTE